LPRRASDPPPELSLAICKEFNHLGNKRKMRQKGPKSTVSPLSVIDGGRGTKPAPPGMLNDFEAATWAQIVGSQPADWFDKATEPLLIQYCRHVSNAAVVNERMAKLKKSKLATVKALSMFDKLTKMLDRETRAMLSCARSMRITQQSINPDRAQTAKRKHTESAGAQPWEFSKPTRGK